MEAHVPINLFIDAHLYDATEDELDAITKAGDMKRFIYFTKPLEDLTD